MSEKIEIRPMTEFPQLRESKHQELALAFLKLKPNEEHIRIRIPDDVKNVERWAGYRRISVLQKCAVVGDTSRFSYRIHRDKKGVRYAIIWKRPAKQKLKGRSGKVVPPPGKMADRRSRK